MLAWLKQQQNPAIIFCGLKRESISCFPGGTSVIRNYYNITQSPLCGCLLWDVIPDSAHCCSPDWLAWKKRWEKPVCQAILAVIPWKFAVAGESSRRERGIIAIILLTNSKHCTKIKSSLKQFQVICPSKVIPVTEMLLTLQQAGNTIKEKRVRTPRTNCGCRVCIQMLLMDYSALQMLSHHRGSLSGQGSRGLRHKRNNRLCGLLYFSLLQE